MSRVSFTLYLPYITSSYSFSPYVQVLQFTKTMFHDGDLQSGIARAVQESKSVVCFVNGEHPLWCFSIAGDPNQT